MFKKLFLLAVLAAFAFGAEAKVSLQELLATPNNKSLLRQLSRDKFVKYFLTKRKYFTKL